MSALFKCLRISDLKAATKERLEAKAFLKNEVNKAIISI
jgi:hypothetical protein